MVRVSFSFVAAKHFSNFHSSTLSTIFPFLNDAMVRQQYYYYWVFFSYCSIVSSGLYDQLIYVVLLFSFSFQPATFFRSFQANNERKKEIPSFTCWHYCCLKNNHFVRRKMKLNKRNIFYFFLFISFFFPFIGYASVFQLVHWRLNSWDDWERKHKKNDIAKQINNWK